MNLPMPCVMPSVHREREREEQRERSEIFKQSLTSGELIDRQGRAGTLQAFCSLPHLLFLAHSGASARTHTHTHTLHQPPQNKNISYIVFQCVSISFLLSQGRLSRRRRREFHQRRHSQQRRFYGIKVASLRADTHRNNRGQK